MNKLSFSIYLNYTLNDLLSQVYIYVKMQNSKLFKIGLLAEVIVDIYLKNKNIKIIGNNNNSDYD